MPYQRIVSRRDILTAVRRMWVYRVNCSATHPLRDQSFSFFWMSYTLQMFAPVSSLESDLGIPWHLWNVVDNVALSCQGSIPFTLPLQLSRCAELKHETTMGHSLWKNGVLWIPWIYMVQICSDTLNCCAKERKPAIVRFQARRWSLLPENLTKLLADSRLLHWFTQIHGFWVWMGYEFKQFGCCWSSPSLSAGANLFPHFSQTRFAESVLRNYDATDCLEGLLWFAPR